MGVGEWYMWMWSRWFDSLPEAARSEYVAEWEPKAPDQWRGWLPSGRT
jgi:hypothetical protein